MTNFVSDDFTDTAGTVLTSHTGATGATWTMGTGYNSANLPVISDANRLRGGTTVGITAFASGVGSVDAGYTEAIIETKTNVAGFGIYVRGYANLAGSARGYLAYYGTSGAWQIYRLDNSSTLTAIGSGTTSLLSVGTHTLRLTATGVGASVALELKLDGSTLLSVSDTGGSRITTFGSPGVFFATTASNTAGTHIDSIIGVDPVTPTISITTPVDGKIHQRSGTSGTISVTGTYAGTPTTIEARLVEFGTTTPITGFDWATKVASPSGSAYSFSFTSVPQGGWYSVQVRHSNDTAVNATSGNVGVGALIALTGQSQAYLWFRSRSTALTPNGLVRAFGIFGTWSVPNTGAMAGAIAFGNALATALSIPVGVLDYAADSSYLHNYSANSWLPVTNAPYVAFKSGALTGLDGKLEAVVWVQGESDVLQSASQSQYYADLGTLFTAIRSDSGQATLPIVMVTLARWLGGTVTDAQMQAVRLAQVQKCADADIYRVDREDLPLSGDNLHHTGPAFETMGIRCAQALSYSLGVATYYRGPQIISVAQISSTVYDVNLTHNASGTDFTPTSAITGWRVLDTATPITVSTAVRQSASKVRLTLASAPSALPSIQYLYGATPDITGVLVDNSALALPLEFNGGVTAQNTNVSPGAGAITITGYAPTIQQPIAVSPGAGAITITGYAPTIQQPIAVSPGAGAITVTGYAPTIQQPITVSPGTGTIAVTGYAPSITQSIGIAPGTGTITVTGYAPSIIQTSGAITISPITGQITITGFSPAIIQAGASAQQQILNALKALLLAGSTVAGPRVFLHRTDPLQPEELPAIVIDEGDSLPPETIMMDGGQMRELDATVYCTLASSVTASSDCKSFGLAAEKLIAADPILRGLCQFGVSLLDSSTITNGEGDRLLAANQQKWRFAYYVHPHHPDIINPS